jgi:hypothetical protein
MDQISGKGIEEEIHMFPIWNGKEQRIFICLAIDEVILMEFSDKGKKVDHIVWLGNEMLSVGGMNEINKWMKVAGPTIDPFTLFYS